MVTAVIVQARIGSIRLPAKVMLGLPTRRTVLEEVLHRCQQIPGVDVVVLAVPDTAENDILVRSIEMQSFTGAVLHGKRIQIVRGPEHDVLARYAKAAEAVNADVIMRITADCPLIDPHVCGLVLAASKPVDYCSNVLPRTYPQGFDCEVFTRDLLRRCEAQQHDAHEREHVTPRMQTADGIRRANVFAPEDRSHLRWTLDTKDDYVRIYGVLEQQMREATPLPRASWVPLS